MELSIVVATYNVAPYLNELLAALIKCDAQIIVVDDGSTDETFDVCQRYEAIIEYVHVENGGLGRARNIGMRYVSGDYVWFVDGDDLINVQNVLEIKRRIAGSPDLVIFGWQTITNDGVFVGNGRDMSQTSPFTTAVWNKCFKISWLREHEFEFPEGVLFEDMAFAFETFNMARDIQRIPIIGYYYRQRAGSITLGETVDQHRIAALEHLNNSIQKYSDWQDNTKLYQMVMGNWWYHVRQMSQFDDQLFDWYREWKLDFRQFTDLSYQMNWVKRKLLLWAIQHKNTDMISDLAKHNNKAVLKDMENILMHVVLGRLKNNCNN